jgi:hypothetical protein
MNSVSDEVLFLITEFLVVPRDYIALRSTCKRVRETLPSMIGTNLEYYLSHAEAFWEFREKILIGNLNEYWSFMDQKVLCKMEPFDLLFWDLSKENCFPHNLLIPSDDLAVDEAMETIRRTASRDNIQDVDVLFLLDWAFEFAAVVAFESVILIAYQIDTVRRNRHRLLSEALRTCGDMKIFHLISRLFDPGEFPLDRSIWLELVEIGNDEVISELVGIGALNLNEVDDSGRSLLMRIIRDCHDLAILLINKGADVHIRDSYGKNALDYLIDDSTDFKPVVVAKLLFERGVKVKLSLGEIRTKPQSALMRYLKWSV